MTDQSTDYIVILHGILRSSHHMRKLTAFLSEQGYEVIAIDYPSSQHCIEELIDIIHQKIEAQVIIDKPIHFVGYSLGGLLLRALLHKYQYKRLGRVVQLAPPNQGSEIADLLKGNWLYQKIYGPAGQQLITNQKEFEHLFGKVNYSVGVISGDLNIDPFCAFFIPGSHDGKVSVERSKLSDMTDHIVVRASHTFFPHSKSVQQQTLYFIQHNCFNHSSPSERPSCEKT
tara:strand:- start:5543 stop:6229 length:687 start_codon:yes stop_codon:yes gene_type:complete